MTPAVFAFLRLRAFWKWLFASLVPVAVISVLVVGVRHIDRWARAGLRSHERYRFPFADIDCAPPPLLSRTDFLAEVQNLAGLPDQVSLLTEELPETLQLAFARHPWVESVQRVEVLPGRQVRVRLAYRTPVLAVGRTGRKRAVDGHGVVLPSPAVGEDLPVYCSPVPVPAGSAGSAWADESLQAAARTMAFLRSQPQAPHFALVESAVSGLVLTTTQGSRVLWGRAVDDSPGGQESARRKYDRLLQHCRRHGDLDHPNGPCEHDLRSLD
jgi:hypothetical protein